MRLHEFVPVADPEYRGESLIDAVFGPGFCVVDETGCLLTTGHNRNLLRRACTLAANAAALSTSDLADALAELRQRAENLSQDQYDRAVAREYRRSDTGVEWDNAGHDAPPYDHTHRAGSLE
jgi:hypothetical protein